MPKRLKFAVFTALLVCCTSFMYTKAEGTVTAADITKNVAITSEKFSISAITDDNIATHSAGENAEIAITSEIPMGGIYIKYNKAPQTPGSLNGAYAIAENAFLHEYIPLDGTLSATLSYVSADICDIFIFSEGETPDYVQKWEVGEPETDLLLCATHSDDDQLFFAGLIPYCAGHMGLRVRVAYFVNHYDTYNRTHELLDGLWHCGLKYYPDISPFPDGYSESISGAEGYLASKGISHEDIVAFQRGLLDKYKPLVVVLHDFDGEYGHGAHMLNTATFVEACENAESGEYVPEKIYIHLYEQGTLTLDIDTPLDEFGGKTAFQVSQDAFRFHKSQHWTWFYDWIYGKSGNVTLSSQIKSYNPAKYGLYFSSVGADTGKNDMFENVETYDVRIQKELEKQRLEQLEKQKEEEQKRLEEEENAKKELALKEQQEKIEQAQKEAEQRKKYVIIAVSAVIIIVIVVLTALILIKTNNKSRRHLGINKHRRSGRK